MANPLPARNARLNQACTKVQSAIDTILSALIPSWGQNLIEAVNQIQRYLVARDEHTAGTPDNDVDSL